MVSHSLEMSPTSHPKVVFKLKNEAVMKDTSNLELNLIRCLMWFCSSFNSEYTPRYAYESHGMLQKVTNKIELKRFAGSFRAS